MRGRATPTDPGRQRRLARLTGTGNVVTGIALDLDRALRTAVTEPPGPPPTPLQTRQFGTELARALAGLASVVQLDEPCGGEALRIGAIPSQVAITMPLVAEGHSDPDGATASSSASSDDPGHGRVLDAGHDWPDPETFSPQRALWWGADACHLAIGERPAGADSSAAWDDLVARAVAACHVAGVPLIVEPIVTRSRGETATAFAADAVSRLVDSTARLAGHGPDLIAIRMPTARAAGRMEAPDRERAAWRAIDRACGVVPWVIVDDAERTGPFEDQIRAAGAAGASGFIAGPSVWQAALTLETGERRRAIESIAVPAFTRFVEAAWTSCHPLAERPAIHGPHRHAIGQTSSMGRTAASRR